MAMVWGTLVPASAVLWPRRPRAAALCWAAVFPLFALVFWPTPAMPLVFVGMMIWAQLVRAQEAAHACAGELSRFEYVRYVLDVAQVPAADQVDPPAGGVILRRVARGLLLGACAAGLLAFGWWAQPWRVHPYLDDLLVLLEVAFAFTAACDVLLALNWLVGTRSPEVHDPTFFAARSLRDFWGRRWNKSFSRTLHRAVFLPSGGRRHLVRGVMWTFFVSGLVHGAPMLLVSVDRFACVALACAAVLFFVVHGVGTLLETRLPRRARRVTLYALFLLTAPLYPGTMGTVVGLHARPLQDATVLHLLRGLGLPS